MLNSVPRPASYQERVIFYHANQALKSQQEIICRNVDKVHGLSENILSSRPLNSSRCYAITTNGGRSSVG
jgi:hypothetical protein